MLPAASSGQSRGSTASFDLSAELSRLGVPRSRFDAALAANGLSAQDLSVAEHLWAQIRRADVPSIISALMAFQLCDSEKRALLMVSYQVDRLRKTEELSTTLEYFQADFRELLNVMMASHRYLELHEIRFEDDPCDLLVYAFSRIDKMYASREFGSGSSGDLLQFDAKEKMNGTVSVGGEVDDTADESAASSLREELEPLETTATTETTELPETAIERIAHALCDMGSGEPQQIRPEGWQAAKVSDFVVLPPASSSAKQWVTYSRLACIARNDAALIDGHGSQKPCVLGTFCVCLPCGFNEDRTVAGNDVRGARQCRTERWHSTCILGAILENAVSSLTTMSWRNCACAACWQPHRCFLCGSIERLRDQPNSCGQTCTGELSVRLHGRCSLGGRGGGRTWSDTSCRATVCCGDHVSRNDIRYGHYGSCMRSSPETTL